METMPPTETEIEEAQEIAFAVIQAMGLNGAYLYVTTNQVAYLEQSQTATIVKWAIIHQMREEQVN